MRPLPCALGRRRIILNQYVPRADPHSGHYCSRIAANRLVTPEGVLNLPRAPSRPAEWLKPTTRQPVLGPSRRGLAGGSARLTPGV
jgi:hypothetical protein